MKTINCDDKINENKKYIDINNDKNSTGKHDIKQPFPPTLTVNIISAIAVVIITTVIMMMILVTI